MLHLINYEDLQWSLETAFLRKKKELQQLGEIGSHCGPRCFPFPFCALCVLSLFLRSRGEGAIVARGFFFVICVLCLSLQSKGEGASVWPQESFVFYAFVCLCLCKVEEKELVV